MMWIYMSRAWTSNKSSVALAQMLGLHRLDTTNRTIRKSTLVFKDLTELEEARRTFWYVYQCDRWSSSAVGLPLAINERDVGVSWFIPYRVFNGLSAGLIMKQINTNLPCSDKDYEAESPQPTTSLHHVLNHGLQSIQSAFALHSVVAAIFGRISVHLDAASSDDGPGATDSFWDRHREIDHLISMAFLSLPPGLNMSSVYPNVEFYHMNLHAATITLHNAVVRRAQDNGMEAEAVNRSERRSGTAAEEILEAVKSMAHKEPKKVREHRMLGL